MVTTEINNVPISEADFVVLDFETTGTSGRFDRAIELGMVRIKNLEIKETYSSFFNPGRPLPPFITKLTGITNDDVNSAPTFDSKSQEIVDFIGDSVICAHNLQFDKSFLKNELEKSDHVYPQNPELCTLKLARRVFPELKSKSLGSVVKHLRVFHKGVHRALGDATATSKILIKMIEILKEEHHIHSLDELIKFQGLGSSKSSGKFTIMKKQLANDYLGLPDHPGIYFFKNKKDEIIYIGKAKSLKKRLKNYFSSSAAGKAKKIVRASNKLSYLKTNSELTALLSEAQFIKTYSPKFNSQLKKYGNTYFVRISSTEEFPKLKVTSKFDFDGNDYYGPFNRRETASELKDIAEYTFQMRECTEKDYKKKKKCYLADIHRCLAPCIDQSVKEKYDLEISQAVDLLKGISQVALNNLLNKMKYFSEKQKYEEAAKIRDKVNLLLSHVKKSSILAEPINNANVVIEIREYGRKDYLLITDGKIVVKNDPALEKDLFNTLLKDYFLSTHFTFHEFEKRDEEMLKISLSWLCANRTKANIFYLNDYQSFDELMFAMSTN